MTNSSFTNAGSSYDMMDICAIKVFNNVFISVIFVYTLFFKESEIEEMVKKLELQTEEKKTVNICITLQKLAQYSFHLKYFLFFLNFLLFFL
jgi:hypothetical protein